jgi:hypothetical protein
MRERDEERSTERGAALRPTDDLAQRCLTPQALDRERSDEDDDLRPQQGELCLQPRSAERDLCGRGPAVAGPAGGLAGEAFRDRGPVGQVFLGDTGAYLGGRMWGRTKLSPRISPNKTVEGLVAGIAVGTLAFWLAGLYQNWLNGVDALVIGAAVAFAAPIGDLFESLIKRDVGVKDAGSAFGPHGGVLDRLDAAFFTVVAAYYVALAVI